MFDLAWLVQWFVSGRPKRKHVQPPSQNYSHAFYNAGTISPCILVSAPTRSEARAKVKKERGLKTTAGVLVGLKTLLVKGTLR